MTTDNEYSKDTFERVREALWGAPGFQHRNNTIKTEGWSFLPMTTWVVETIKTDDSVSIFIEMVNRDGGHRFVLPQKVCETIYRQEYRIKRKRRSVGAKRAMEQRMKDPNYHPFGGKPFRKGQS